MPSVRSIHMKIEGLEQCLKNLETLKESVQRKVLRTALSKGTQPVLKATKALVPKKTGQLRKSLGRKIRTYRKSGTVVAIIGPRKGFFAVINGRRVNPVKYAHLVEFGRRAVTVKTKKVLSDGSVVYGKRTRAIMPQSFIRKGWMQTRSQAKSIIEREVKLGIEREAARLAVKR